MEDLGAGLVVADTDVVIDFLRGRGPGVAAVRTLLEQRRLRLTVITAFELRLGASFIENQGPIKALFHRKTLGLSLAAGFLAGKVFSDLRSVNREIGVKDCLIAGICLQHDLPLATRNVAHFERVEGLRLIPIPT